MTSDNFTVREVKTFLLEHTCKESGCASILVLKLAETNASAKRAKSMTPPDVNGWVNGYCPEHKNSGE